MATESHEQHPTDSTVTLPDQPAYGVKRKNSTHHDDSNYVPNYTALVLDIEGTLCPLSFVHDTLFPYVTNNLESYVYEHCGSSTFQPHLDALRSTQKADWESGDEKLKAAPEIPDGNGSDEKVKRGVVENVQWQMSWDRKAGALKGLQGEMWKVGYEKGELKGLWVDF